MPVLIAVEHHASLRRAAWRLAKRQARAIRKRKYKLRAIRTLIRHLKTALAL